MAIATFLFVTSLLIAGVLYRHDGPVIDVYYRRRFPGEPWLGMSESFPMPLSPRKRRTLYHLGFWCVFVWDIQQ